MTPIGISLGLHGSRPFVYASAALKIGESGANIELAASRSAVGFAAVADAVDGECVGSFLEENAMVADAEP